MIDVNQVSLVWVAERATGLTALALLSIATFLGAVTSAGWTSKRFPEVRSVLLHRNISLLSLVFLLVHIIGVVADSYIDVPLSATLIPFTANYKVVGVGLGTLAFDLLIAIFITSYLRGRIKPRLWRLIHDVTYVVWALSTVHALTAGYERGLTFLVAAFGVALVVPTIVLRYARPARNPALETPR